MKLARYKRYLVIAAMNRVVTCAHVPALPDADPTLCWKCGRIITAEAGRPWRLATAEEMAHTYIRNAMDHRVIVSREHPELAWSGARWVPHDNGFAKIGPDSVAVCSFATIEEARQYAEERFPVGRN